ncbi:ATP-dependent DNA helicase UvrD/PcrA, clostridial paralog 2 [Aquipluma nitroreducens]|uniref:DNA 3'-5' helicase n=1 Tax=Aquipluma nitroreducens TaxID=2010828 RepID=A0A5K7S470_9BACT|nr:ATP-dependent helicase [Aquipluma nitroreducens]BBE16270.1 ATP-dependent DNA helicase UvrD/PcrA, clostridial paralog 2 [Aquipluma nitroreducens]
MPDINSLPHISTLENIETDFKVFAGPGAGKTTWLISHLERVLRESNRLNKTGKIACITYTNVAADEIQNRLKCDKNRFDISTIHSFLFRNIVKPFSYLIEKNDDAEVLFDTSKLDGHDEHIPRRDMIESWVRKISEGKTKYWYLTSAENYPKLSKCLSDIDWSFDENGILQVKFRNRWTNSTASEIRMPSSKLFDYKQICWRKGFLYHEDVLYFSHLIISRSPRILEFIRIKFPYLFIDEFQDTTEIQTWIIEKITESNSKVGIVGDLAQSIYKFTGAKRTDFLNFKNGDASEFKLNHNHRSTNRIVDFLNLLRPDINQEYGQNKPDGSFVKILIGTIQAAKTWYEENYPENTLYILTRKNTTVSEINNQLGVANSNLLNDLYSNDSNPQRVKFIHSILMSIRLHEKGDLKNALNEIFKSVRRSGGSQILKLSLRRIAINIIDALKVDENRSKSIAEFYLEVKDKILDEYGFEIGSGLRAGNAKSFYETHSINDILPFIKVDTKSDEFVRTIHSAKGTEFENTLVHFETINEFRNYIINGQNHIDSLEDDCRIYYVGCSRAMKNLYISIPDANEADIENIENLSMEYVRV